MAILKIARMGHPVLRGKAADIADPGAPEIRRLIGDMMETLADAGGAGLAAPQVHQPLRVVIFHIPPEGPPEGPNEEPEEGADEGAEEALPSPSFAMALEQAAMVVFCPSNPFLSLGPILAIPGVRESLAAAPNKVAVSPIIGGEALRGPAAKIMAELGYPASCVGVARQYQGICDYFLLDQQDAGLAPEIKELGMTPLVAPIIMESDGDKVALANYILNLPTG